MRACTYGIDHWMPATIVGRLTAKLVDAWPLNLWTAKLVDRVSAKLVNHLTAKLVNLLTAKLVDRLIAKLVVVNFNS